MTRRAELWAGRVRAAFEEAIGVAGGDADQVVAVEEGFGPVHVDVPADRWAEALLLARDGLDCSFFDFLTAVDEWRPEPVDGVQGGFRVVCHLAARPAARRREQHPRGVEHLVVRTLVPRESPVLQSVVHVYAGARWHERETHEMFGIDFTDGPDGEVLHLEKLLLPEEFEGHPLRKEFVLASRVAKPWPGAKEPGESDHAPAGRTSRRRNMPPGVPDDWPVSVTDAAEGSESSQPRSSTTGDADG